MYRVFGNQCAQCRANIIAPESQLDEIENRPSLICEPLPPPNVITLRRTDCEVVRLLFVATRDQVQALTATLECEGLE